MSGRRRRKRSESSSIGGSPRLKRKIESGTREELIKLVVERKREREESNESSRPTKRRRERIVIPTRIRRGVKRTLSHPSYPEKKRQIVCESEVNYDEVLNDGKTEKEISKEEKTSRENNVVTGFEIVPYRGRSVFSPCKSIVPYESKPDLVNFLHNHHTVLPFKAKNALPSPIVPSEKYLRTLNESTVKIENDSMDLHSESSMDGDSYSMDID